MLLSPLCRRSIFPRRCVVLKAASRAFRKSPDVPYPQGQEVQERRTAPDCPVRATQEDATRPGCRPQAPRQGFHPTDEQRTRRINAHKPNKGLRITGSKVAVFLMIHTAQGPVGRHLLPVSARAGHGVIHIHNSQHPSREGYFLSRLAVRITGAVMTFMMIQFPIQHNGRNIVPKTQKFLPFEYMCLHFLHLYGGKPSRIQ